MSRRIVVNRVPIEWSERGDRFTFFGIEGIVFWKRPSLLSILAPLRDALGERMFSLLIAFEAAKGTYEDYHQMVENLGADFAEGFTNWGRAVSGAGWGGFRLEELDWERPRARVRVERPWEAALFRPDDPQHIAPFLDGKLSGIFSWAFDTNCRARVVDWALDCPDPWVLFSIEPSMTTLQDELARLQEERGLSPEEQLQAANRHLREHLDRFMDVVGAVGEFIWETDRHLQITFASEQMEQVLGYPVADLEGIDLRRLLTPSGRQALADALADYHPADAHSLRLEAPARTAAGATRWLALALTPTFDLHGAVNGYRGAGRDITEERAAKAELEAHREHLEAEVARRTEALEQANDRNRLLLESIGEGVFGLDADGRITFINPAGAQMLGYRVEELVGRQSHPLIHHTRADGSTFPETGCPVLAVLRDGRPRRVAEGRFRRADGSTLLVGYYASPIMSTVGRYDVHGSTNAAEARDGRERRAGVPGGSAPVMSTEGRYAGAPGGSAPVMSTEGRYAGAPGGSAPVTGENAVAGVVVSFRDIRERHEAELVLAARAYYDEMTGLANRASLVGRAERVLAEAGLVDRRVGLLVINLDRFKDVNDSLGHAVGDWLLQRVAGRLHRTLHPGETLARLGSDEFACLLEDIAEPEEATAAACRYLEAFAEPVNVGYQTIEIAASIGISLFPDHGNTAESLFQHADAALHLAKERGRRRYELYSAGLTAAAARRMQLEAALRDALDRDEIEVRFQPQLELATGRLVGAEALARWHHAEWGWVSPAEFVPVAEESGLIHALGRRVLGAVCQQLRRWYAAGFPLDGVAVNVSPRQLEWEDLPDHVANALAEAGLPPSVLELEVTEEAFLREPERAARVLHRLQEVGVRIAIDDFGTGYSSLAYLKTLPVDRLKIDRSFVAGVPDDPQDAAIIRAVIALGRSLGLEVLAEGVETEAQAAFLRAERCHHTQGFLYGRAMSPEDLQQAYGGDV